jgi:hypothetical protein
MVLTIPSALILRSDHIADVIASRTMAAKVLASWFETHRSLSLALLLTMRREFSQLL